MLTQQEKVGLIRVYYVKGLKKPYTPFFPIQNMRVPRFWALYVQKPYKQWALYVRFTVSSRPFYLLNKALGINLEHTSCR